VLDLAVVPAVQADVPATAPVEEFAAAHPRCGATTFCPDAIVTREQMAVFLVRAFHLPM
jgi:hypothetical protein